MQHCIINTCLLYCLRDDVRLLGIFFLFQFYDVGMISFGANIIDNLSSVRLDAKLSYDIVLPFLHKASNNRRQNGEFKGELHLKADQNLQSPLFTVVDRYVQTNGGNNGVNFTGEVLFFVEWKQEDNNKVCT